MKGEDIKAIALDTTGSSVIPVGDDLQPMDEYYLWCDHRSAREAALITSAARQCGLEAIDWCGGTYSSEWGFSKLLHWLRHNPDKRDRFVTAFEHCDMLTATLCGNHRSCSGPAQHLRDGSQMDVELGSGRLPSGGVSVSVDPLLAGVRAKLQGRYATSDQIAGRLCRRIGRMRSDCVPVFRFLWVPSTRIGTRSAQGSVAATWSTSSERPPASSPSPNR